MIVRRYAARPARCKINSNSVGWNVRRDRTWFTGKDATPARVEYDVGDAALHPGSVTPIFREILRRAFKAGAFGDLDAKVFTEQLGQISAPSTRVGINQDYYFAAGENLAGIMDALRWKSPWMPLLYNRNLAAEQDAAGRLLGKIKWSRRGIRRMPPILARGASMRRCQ